MMMNDQAMTTLTVPTPSQRPENREGGNSGRHRYDFYWNQISHLAPEAVLLRGPSQLNPLQAGSDGDLDILLTTNRTAVETFLAQQGFHHSYKPQAYLKRFQLFLKDAPAPYTIELYFTEQWGLGFRLHGSNHGPADPNLARLFHATADGKGMGLFPNYLDDSLVPNRYSSGPGAIFSGRIGRVLWRKGNTKLLTAYLVLRGMIRPDFMMISRTLLRKMGYRLWQLTHKSGLEIGVIGPDGAGKSSLASALLGLPLPVRVIYMGYNEYHTRVMAFAMRRNFPTPLKQLAAGYDFFMRRLRGWILSRRGWVIVYDRHPAERLIARPAGFWQKLANSFKRLYAWPLDLTFWLTGDYEKIYERKKEQCKAELEFMDRQFAEILHCFRIPFERIDVTHEDANAVLKIAAERILAMYRERHAMENLSGLMGSILKF